MELWVIIVVIGVITYALRLSFIAFMRGQDLPAARLRALRLVPAAVLAALIAPDLFLRGGALYIAPGNARLVAGLLAALVAWRTRNVLLTISVGMAALLLVQALVR